MAFSSLPYDSRSSVRQNGDNAGSVHDPDGPPPVLHLLLLPRSFLLITPSDCASCSSNTAGSLLKCKLFQVENPTDNKMCQKTSLHRDKVRQLMALRASGEPVSLPVLWVLAYVKHYILLVISWRTSQKCTSVLQYPFATIFAMKACI